MIRSKTQCKLKTNREKTWPYIQYYIGQKDNEQRKNGQGENHWSGAKSLESYSGHIVCDTMHGKGDYRWRYYGPHGTFVTYEGHFFDNQIHGYGSISYGDGRVFKGLFHGNVRWGPGIESHTCVKEDVGLWSDTKLIRLCWCPEGPSITPDLMSSNIGREVVKQHRKVLSSSVKTIGDGNSALELLKHYGANPLAAVKKWSKLYPKHCTDLSSALCYTEMFEQKYYTNKIYTLESNIEIPNTIEKTVSDEMQECGYFYVWNNNDLYKHMMKHCYKHESQRKILGLDLGMILSGPRKLFKSAGQHEIDSRTLLMACYLGNISKVAQLINENKVHPDVADLQGNTALMYATCGDEANIITFLVEAGANVNSYNDSCFTPLGMALIKLACAYQDIPPNSMLQAILPTYLAPTSSSIERRVSEWVISRDAQSFSVGPILTKSPSKTNKNMSSKKIKSLTSLKEQPGGKRKLESGPPKVPENISEQSIVEENSVYDYIYNEYTIRVNDVYQVMSVNPVLDIFEINDMIKEVDTNEEDHKKLPEKNPKKTISKVLKDATNPSKDAMWQDENTSLDNIEKQKRDTLARIMTTVCQLLSNGADPKLVKCPLPALFIAITSESSEAIKKLICYGADVNEVFPEVLGYTALDIAISRPFTYDNLEVIKVLLEHDADTQHRLVYKTNEITAENLGPTLLHTVLARRTANEIEEEIRRQLVELLLDYNCNPIVQFKGKSAIDISMTKGMDIFDIFIRSSKTNLNSVINDHNQNVLVKMFHLPFFKTIAGSERLQKITDLLLFGANPLMKCQNGEDIYENIFVFAKNTLREIDGTQTKLTSTGTAAKQDLKSKKLERSKKDDKSSNKSLGKVIDDLGEYKQALELTTNCARLLHIRWLQANLVKKLIDVIKKYSHRHWSMILKEVKYKKNIGLWLTPQRCMEIWRILASAKKKDYEGRHILRHILKIVLFCTNRITNNISLTDRLTANENGTIEKNIRCLLHDHRDSESLNTEVLWKRCYVKPELIRNNAKLFNVCFECALPLREDKIPCISCKLVSFCSFECMQSNINRGNCHPCSKILKDKYFPINSEEVSVV